VLVLGLARSGRAAALALARRAVEVVGVDRAQVDTEGFADAGIEVRAGDDDVSLLDGVGLVVKSPGVPEDAELVEAARERGVPVWSEIELGYRLLPNPILGVTGTNGKTTTSELLGAIFRAAGEEVAVAGNVGRALCEVDGQLAPAAWVVCELSSFQLEGIDEFRPRVAVLLNLEPDHLDRHGSFEAYRDAKLRAFENQNEDDTAVLPRGFGPVPGGATRVEFSAADELPAEPLLRGTHNRENAAAATAAARAAGISDDAISAGLQTFPGVAHRLEVVGEIRGVRYVNDSKATNVAAALRALEAYKDEPVHLILGGSQKGEDFRPLADAIGLNVKAVYVIGETADELVEVIQNAVWAEDLTSAFDLIAAEPGDVVLLSPACASYDQYRDFEDRGEEFRRLVQNLAG
jgi:UDP-N-acetylmuramoylalanine--D-glutamate ligase